MYKHVDRFHNH